VLTETVFSLPGIGLLMTNAVESRDYPLVMGSVLAVALLFVLVNLVVDVLYAALDPRIRLL
jgi:peptide/nickel transport system permease protein